MTNSQIPVYDVIPTGRGLRIECWHPAQMCSIACMKNMRGLNYNESVQDADNRKTISIEPWKCCDYSMAQGLYFIASNICNACRMHEQASR
ncbi:MAG: hypothetical protein K2M34_01185 [Alphaproteobacteria bacterium]|nr:hypothetical protein [Alphaproteobacteria bacterium]